MQIRAYFYIAGTDKETRYNWPSGIFALFTWLVEVETLTSPAGAALPASDTAAGARMSSKLPQESLFRRQVRLPCTK